MCLINKETIFCKVTNIRQFLIDLHIMAHNQDFYGHTIFALLWCAKGARKFQAFFLNTSIVECGQYKKKLVFYAKKACSSNKEPNGARKRNQTSFQCRVTTSQVTYQMQLCFFIKSESNILSMRNNKQQYFTLLYALNAVMMY